MVFTFVLLGAAIISLWFKPIKIKGRVLYVWPFFGVLAVISGSLNGIVTPIGIAVLGIFALVSYIASRETASRYTRWASFGATAILALALAAHALPGFNNPIVARDLVFSEYARPFTQYANFDKAAVGLILVGLFCHRCDTFACLGQIIRRAAPISAMTAFGVILIACVLGYTRPDIKFPDYAPVFLVINLLFTCIPEEAFFRGVVQENLARRLAAHTSGQHIAAVCSGLLFGVVHVGGGAIFAVLSTLVGIGSAYTYAKTRKIEAPIISHFLVNAVHFFFFTYPSLK